MATSESPVEMSDLRGPAAFEQLIKLEQRARRIFLNQPLFLPGLMQVAGYATAMIGEIAGLKSGDRELTDRVQVRMRRAESFAGRLRDSEPPEVWVPIDEAVLRHVVGGADVMRQQIDHLLELAAQKTVHLAIIPLSRGAHPGLAGSFEVHEMPGGEASVFFEGSHTDEIVGRDQSVPHRYRQLVESMMSSGIAGDEARVRVEAIRAAL